MHVDNNQLAAYLDGALDSMEQAAVRAHLLTCVPCRARLQRLRADAQAIRALAQAGAVPNMRAAIRAKRRAQPLRWIGPGMALAGIAAVLLLFMLLIGARSGATVGWMPDRLFVVDKNQGELIALNAADGSQLGSVALGGQPGQIVYDRYLNRLYILAAHGIVAVDPQTLSVTARWTAAPDQGSPAAMVLDERHGRLLLSWPQAGMISALDAATLTPASFTPDGRTAFQIAVAPRALALAPDGRTLYALDSADSTLRAIDLMSFTISSWPLGPPHDQRTNWLAVSADGQRVYVLRGPSASGDPPELRRVNVLTGQVSAAAPVLASPPPWDMALLGDQLAIAHGDGQRGGVELIAAHDLRQLARIDPEHDQHHLVAGPAGTLFALNFSHGTVTRYDLHSRAAIWRTPQQPWRPWDGVYVPGGWHWPF